MTTAEKMRTVYTSPSAMTAWIIEAGKLPDQLMRAQQCLRVAQDPQSRFGLRAGSVAVQAVCERAIRRVREQVYMMIADLHGERAQGLTWGECSGWRYGFSPVNVSALGIEWFGLSRSVSQRLADDPAS